MKESCMDLESERERKLQARIARMQPIVDAVIELQNVYGGTKEERALFDRLDSLTLAYERAEAEAKTGSDFPIDKHYAP